jgi:hypothetical protein
MPTKMTSNAANTPQLAMNHGNTVPARSLFSALRAYLSYFLVIVCAVYDMILSTMGSKDKKMRSKDKKASCEAKFTHVSQTNCFVRCFPWANPTPELEEPEEPKPEPKDVRPYKLIRNGIILFLGLLTLVSSVVPQGCHDIHNNISATNNTVPAHDTFVDVTHDALSRDLFHGYDKVSQNEFDAGLPDCTANLTSSPDLGAPDTVPRMEAEVVQTEAGATAETIPATATGPGIASTVGNFVAVFPFPYWLLLLLAIAVYGATLYYCKFVTPAYEPYKPGNRDPHGNRAYYMDDAVPADNTEESEGEDEYFSASSD